MKILQNTKRNVIYTMSFTFILGVILLAGCDRKDSTTKEDTTSNAAVTAEATDSGDINTEEQSEAITSAPESIDNITYNNSDYGFTITLPVSWDGYTIQTEDWQGTSIVGDNQGEIVETGIKIMIRHPEWTQEEPRQDIPVMIFTLEQWDQVAKEEIAVSAAPIGPSELARNSKYVFALPARYNFAFPTGYEEVEEIIQSGAIKATEIN